MFQIATQIVPLQSICKARTLLLQGVQACLHSKLTVPRLTRCCSGGVHMMLV